MKEIQPISNPEDLLREARDNAPSSEPTPLSADSVETTNELYVEKATPVQAGTSYQATGQWSHQSGSIRTGETETPPANPKNQSKWVMIVVILAIVTGVWFIIVPMITSHNMKNFKVDATDATYTIDYYSDAEIKNLLKYPTTSGHYWLQSPGRKLDMSVDLVGQASEVGSNEKCQTGQEVKKVETKYGQLVACIAKQTASADIRFNADQNRYNLHFVGHDVRNFDSIKGDISKIIDSLKLTVKK